ncbi:MAG: glycerate kinase [Firmicutes bacterium HGW-Firmicutes-12]|nr:MAG: glycerate kinase [Firmicutes bacterium HGW-Firmicutes-12]
MKIVLAPDSYKGSLTAKKACESMAKGIKRALPEADVIQIPMADGGEGTVQSLVDATSGQIHTARVDGPFRNKVDAKYGILGDGETAVIEMAEASGLYLIATEQRNPLHTTTYGTGELIYNALERGCRRFVLGLGGSATNDGGMGMAQALGARFLDEAGFELPPGGGSLGMLAHIETISMDIRIKESSFIVACDVDNPLCGGNGASNVFGPQKGATPEMVVELDNNLSHYANIIKKDLGIDIKDTPGAGAAGGLGAGMLAFLGATLKSGVDIVIEAVELRKHLEEADLVFTGEGQCDFQTINGKVPFGVAREARKQGIPCIVLAGSIGQGIDLLYDHGVTSVFSIVDSPMSLDQAMAGAEELLEKTAERISRVIKIEKEHNY